MYYRLYAECFIQTDKSRNQQCPERKAYTYGVVLLIYSVVTTKIVLYWCIRDPGGTTE